MNRRDILKKTFLGASALGLAGGRNSLLAVTCGTTPEQTEGPFYPVDEQMDTDNDLTFVKDRSKRALGEVIMIKGIVQDQNCNPVPSALVEIWQACAAGSYNHPQDPNPAPRDPNFQFWGRATTNAKGEYFFKTIIPGVYKASEDWDRPPHIHFKVHLRGYEELTTQMYFKGHPLNEKDRILMDLPSDKRNRLIVNFESKDGSSIREGLFPITLKSYL